MLKKYSIDYIAMPKHNKRIFTHLTDDPVEAEEFLMNLLITSGVIKAIRHEGLTMSGYQFDRMIKVAVERVASLLLRESLGLDASEIKDRFGFAA